MTIIASTVACFNRMVRVGGTTPVPIDARNVRGKAVVVRQVRHHGHARQKLN